MSVVVYGIRNCNTVKSALDWLKQNNVAFEFYDFKSRGVTKGKLEEWCSQSGWESLVNKRGTTWRQLSPSDQAMVTDQSSAITLMKEKTSIIKRPVIESGNKVIALGFDAKAYAQIFSR